MPAIDLSGKKIAVVLESKFIPDEIAAYLTGFAVLGAEVELVSRIWYGDHKPASAPFYSDTDPMDDPPWASPQRHDVKRDVSQVDAELDRYAAIIMSANYTSVRANSPVAAKTLIPGRTSSRPQSCSCSRRRCRTRRS